MQGGGAAAPDTRKLQRCVGHHRDRIAMPDSAQLCIQGCQPMWKLSYPSISTHAHTTHKHTCTRTLSQHTPMHTQHIYTYTCVHAHTDTHAHTCTYTTTAHSNAHTDIHTHTHIRTTQDSFVVRSRFLHTGWHFTTRTSGGPGEDSKARCVLPLY